MSQIKTIAIIPARGGSKGIPRKNIQPLNGKPLISYSIQAANNCQLVDDCYVVTECEKIAHVSRSEGAKVVVCPPELTQDNARTEGTVTYLLQELASQDIKPDTFALLLPTSPLRTHIDLKECLEAFFASTANTTISVTAMDHHPYKSYFIEDGVLKPILDAKHLGAPRQQLPRMYRQNGAIFALKTQVYLDNRRFYVEPVLPYIMSDTKSFDIDKPWELKIVEVVIKDQYSTHQD